MFCVYEDRIGGTWQSELVQYGNIKFTAKGRTPIEALTKLFEMIGDDSDESGDSAVDDGTIGIPEGSRRLPPNCS